MKRGYIFWGVLFIVAAGLQLLKSIGWINNFFTFFWPLSLLAIGIWLIINSFISSKNKTGEHASIPLESCSSARIKLDHGAGRLNIHSGTSPTLLLDGIFSPAPILNSSVENGKLNVNIKNIPGFFFWIPGEGRDWDISLANEIPLSLDIDSGASSITLNLKDLLVRDLKLDSGASTTDITLPSSAGLTQVRIDTGAANVRIRVPDNVAAKIHSKSGMASININRRFPKVDHNFYRSPDFDEASNRADIFIEAGMASIEIY